MTAKKTGRPKVLRDILPSMPAPSSVQREFDRMAKKRGLQDYRLVLFLGLLEPKRVESNPVFRVPYLRALEQNPKGVAELKEFLTRKRALSLRDFIEVNPERMIEADEDVLKAYHAAGGLAATPEAVRVAKNAIHPISKKRPRP